MAKLTLDDIDNGSVTSASSTINSNNQDIEDALENTLSRDGTTPNAMGANFDMNGYRILNSASARAGVGSDLVTVDDLAVLGIPGPQGPAGPSGDGTGDLLAANNLSDVDNAATSRTNLGLAIGTDVQAFDAGLASIAGLTTSANQGLYTTGSDAYATFTLSSFGRNLIGDIDAATARSTLGLTEAIVTGAFGTGSGDVAEGDDSRFGQFTRITQNANYSFLLTDIGEFVRHTSGTAHAYTISPTGTTAYPVGSVITVRNGVSGGNVTLTRGAGVSLYLAGDTTNQNLTLAAGGLCTLLHEETNVWVASGSGLS